MLPCLPEKTTINKVRLIASQSDPLPLRLRVDRALRGMSLHPTELPPAAVFCVRRLPHLFSKALPLQDVGPPSGWDRALNAHLAALLRQAARPARGAVSPHAPAVLFADPAELLACLAQDWLAGRLGEYWWWRLLVGNPGRQPMVFATWESSAEYLPAALEILASKGQAAAFIQNLAEGQASSLLAQVFERFGLHALQTVWERYSATAALTASCLRQSAAEIDLDLAPETGTGLKDVLAGLPRPPGQAAAGKPSFPQAAVIPAVQAEQPWRQPQPLVFPWQAIAPECQPDLLPWAALPLPGHLLLGVGLTLARAPQFARSSAFALAVDQALAARGRSEAAGPRAQAHRDTAAARGAQKPRRNPASPAPTPVPAPLVDAPFREEAIPAPSACDLPALSPASLPHHVDTRFGGIFYLLNLAIYLGLYGDFTTPTAPGLDLSPWDLLARVGRAWLGPQIEADPIWSLLAHLAGRDPRLPPGHDFTPPSDWQIPPEWLRALSRSQAARLRKLSQRGVGFWPLLRAYFQARLCRALGLRHPAQVAGLLLCRRAHLRSTSTHLAITFPLAEHPVAIRLSGLDRDLGWIPAAGRFVVYFYE